MAVAGGGGMALATDSLGTVYAGRLHTVDAERARAFAAATNDDHPAYRSGRCAPPVFGAVVGFDALALTVADVVPAEALGTLVHGEHDMHFSAPLVPGTRVNTEARIHSVRRGRSGARLTVRLLTADAATAEPLLEQYATVLLRGWHGAADQGPDKPDHTMPGTDQLAEVGRRGVPVDADQTYRYAAASGDTNPIHVDEEAARRAGLPGIVVHGLCTMAIAGQAVLREVGCQDPGLVRRLAARFSGWVRPGHQLLVTTYAVAPAARSAPGRAGRHVYAFEALSDGQLVVANGCAELEG